VKGAVRTQLLFKSKAGLCPIMIFFSIFMKVILTELFINKALLVYPF